MKLTALQAAMFFIITAGMTAFARQHEHSLASGETLLAATVCGVLAATTPFLYRLIAEEEARQRIRQMYNLPR